MDLHDSVAVVTGSNRGLGREFAAQLLERGAKKVYATARNPETVQIAGVTALGCLLWKYGVPWLHGPLLTSVAAEPEDSKAHLLAVAGKRG